MRRRCVNSPYTITTVFGNVKGYPLNNGFHTGVDYVSTDKLIVSPMDSVVSVKGYDDKNGNYLVLEAYGYRDWFSHIQEYKVTSGAVKMGQVLAVMGETGAADGVHVHHSLRVNGVLVNAEKYVTEEDMITDKDIGALRIGMSEIEGWNGHDVHKGKYDKQILGAWVGKEWKDFIWNGWNKQKTHRINLEDLLKAEKAKSAALVKQVNELKAQQGNTDEATIIGKALLPILSKLGYKKG